MRIGKVYYIAVIFTLIAMLAASDAVCMDSLRPYVQFEKPTKKPNRRQRILEENGEKFEYLYKVREAANKSEEELKKVMRPSTWKLIERLKQDPSDDLQGVIKPDDMLYFEICAVSDPYEITKTGKEIIDNSEILTYSYQDDKPQ
ncbi:MAG: hypothetical protein KKD11_05455 [Candidatus Omnitrophica bacterium]|nr:hypothetical protein [Candidatus Omnitrophota bacterium]